MTLTPDEEHEAYIARNYEAVFGRDYEVVWGRDRAKPGTVVRPVDKNKKIPPGYYSLSGHEVVEAAVTGFLAVKVVGPFLQAWATKLGEKLGESTATTLSRIKVRRVRDGRGSVAVTGTEIEASVPGAHAPTVLILPSRPTDAAKWAFLDLDPTDEAVRGKILFWSERDSAWLSMQERFARFKARHPDVTVSDDCQSASWSGEDGPHSIGCEVASLADRLPGAPVRSLTVFRMVTMV